jgi:hypothetical protein
MTIGRGAIVAGGAVIVTAWVIASGPGPDRAPEAQRKTAAATSMAAPRPSHEERLRDRLAAMPAADDSHRDPFQFGVPRRTEPPRAAVAADAGAEPAVQTPVVPDLQLLGIAEDTRDGQPSRTAVISAMDGLFLVHEGEPIALRYQVRKIGADAVELEDLAAGTTIRLALR